VILESLIDIFLWHIVLRSVFYSPITIVDSLLIVVRGFPV